MKLGFSLREYINPEHLEELQITKRTRKGFLEEDNISLCFNVLFILQVKNTQPPEFGPTGNQIIWRVRAVGAALESVMPLPGHPALALGVVRFTVGNSYEAYTPLPLFLRLVPVKGTTVVPFSSSLRSCARWTAGISVRLLSLLTALLAARYWECNGPVAALRSYLDIRTPTHRIALTRVLTASHHLAVEHGKWHGIAKEWRLCRICWDDIEDVPHVLFLYPFLPADSS
ncbi:hypothetical protein IW262DRAFT_1453845 [Armillaria fumosa]|nr:hypothetical protein IW262DRAFT_1453845 [Armillaria fumosa]